MRGQVVLAAGVIMLLSSAAHGLLGWPEVRRALSSLGAEEPVIGALAIGWFFGSMSMLAFGVVTVIYGRRLTRGDRSGEPAIATIAAAYVLFGTLAIVLRHFNPHFLLFIITGLLAGLPLLRPKLR